MVVNQLQHQKEAEFYPIAFVDDDPNKQNLGLSGIFVMGHKR
ncbi:hypothetical protein BGM26_17725 [Bacillus sp. FJAT-29790]|nr:hypothetical protein [Bacillus sp. FJAT-29790]